MVDSSCFSGDKIMSVVRAPVGYDGTHRDSDQILPGHHMEYCEGKDSELVAGQSDTWYSTSC
ncbi:hypothetical protein ACP4OV_025293 [Aristida adscensionis]